MNKTHQSRLQADSGYEAVSDTNTQEVSGKSNSGATTNSDAEKSDFISLKWKELRTLATERGINVHGKKRDELEKELTEIGDVNVTK